MSVSSPYTWAVGEQVTAAKFNQHLRDNFKGIVPLGGYLYLARNRTAVETIVEGVFAECNGTQISRTTYADYDTLLAGLTPARPFGAGNGSTTVHLPDAQGRTIVGVGTHGDTDLADTDGVALANRSPKHKHSVVQPTITRTTNVALNDPTHRHEMYGSNADGSDSQNWPTNPSDNPQGYYNMYTLYAATGITVSTQPEFGASNGTVGPQTGEPTDTPAHLVAGVLFTRVKY